MALIVQKYGGTSMGSAERIKNVAKRIAQARAAGHDVVVVVSAFASAVVPAPTQRRAITNSNTSPPPTARYGNSQDSFERGTAFMADQVPAGSTWKVVGISREQWSLCAAALTLGGNIRVGLEDNFYLPDGAMARSNGELVEKGVQMTRDIGRAVATVDEARAMLGLAK